MDENTDTSGGYSVGTLSTTDEDNAETFSYSIVGGADAGVFSIGGAGSDELILSDGTLDFEGQSSYSVTVRVTDGGGNSYDETLTVGVNDLNEAPGFSSSGVTAASEDSLYSYSITTTDPDTGNTWTISASTLPAWLSLTDNNDGTATLWGTPTNAEVGDHGVVLQVEDQGGLTDTQGFTITVGNTNDAPVIDSDGGLATANVNAAENQTAVTTVTATDLDGDVPSFSLSGGADQGLFSINGTTGVLSFGGAQDFETFADSNTDGIYEVEVTASDGNGGTDVQLISVTVTDVNETPTDIAPNSFSVDENTDTSGGYSVGTLSTTDEDNAETFSYSIVGGADAGVFSIGGAGSDELILSDGTLDFEGQSSYSVTVRVTDGGGNSYDETLTVGVNDLNEAPGFSSSGVTAASEDSLYSYSITTTDPDTGNTWTISASTLPAWLSLTDNNDGTATLWGTPTNAEVGDHGVVLQVKTRVV